MSAKIRVVHFLSTFGPVYTKSGHYCPLFVHFLSILYQKWTIFVHFLSTFCPVCTKSGHFCPLFVHFLSILYKNWTFTCPHFVQFLSILYKTGHSHIHCLSILYNRQSLCRSESQKCVWNGPKSLNVRVVDVVASIHVCSS